MKWIKKTKKYLQWKLFRVEAKPIDKPQLTSLSPIDDAEDCEVYFESLDWALSQKKKIKNIAVSGAYGSGKSSMLQTYIKKNKESVDYPQNKFLNISLATFRHDPKGKDETANNSSAASKPETPKQDVSSSESPKADDTGKLHDDSELQRLIELSILQQLFFHEEDSKIPDSRFKKIRRIKERTLAVYSLLFVTFISTFLFLVFPDFLAKFAILTISKSSLQLVQEIGAAYVFAILLFVVYKISRPLASASIKKLKLKNAEIEVHDRVNKSILNQHIDEIIYFFEATDYNVIIIEDLDRFKQAEIFTKLREINLLINNSAKIKREIVFVYAIKDDVFLDKDRTKFFDFMIPIIPVIDYSNSGDKLRTKIKSNDYPIAEELIDDLSYFIDDMRLLNNIMNEYYTYSRKVNSTLNHNNLLAIIVYKNLFPNDFTLLNENKGELYGVISKKKNVIEEKKKEIDGQIDKLKIQLQGIIDHQAITIKELRLAYVSGIEETISFQFHPFEKTLFELVEDENFDTLRNGSVQINYFAHYNNHYYTLSQKNHSFDFKEIEKKIHPILTYAEREALLKDKTEIDSIKKKIQELRESKNTAQKAKLKDLLSGKKIKVNVEEGKQNDLISILLKNGYIDENYMDYISIFHEGSLTKTDSQFHIDVKLERGNPFDYKLNKTEELLKKINLYAFEKDYILNYDLVNALFSSANHTQKKELLFKQLSNESERSIQFIKGFVERNENTELFFSELCHYWDNIWGYISSENTGMFETDDQGNYDYLIKILRYADLSDIEPIINNYTQYLNENSKFLEEDGFEKGKLEGIIKTLKLKFKTISSEVPTNYQEYIFENNHYVFNVDIVKQLASVEGDEQIFEEQNYSFVKAHLNSNFQDYIEENINEYIENVFLPLPDNTKENLDNYTKLLNNPILDIDLKGRIVQKVVTIVIDLKTIDTDVWEYLFRHSKVLQLWSNVLLGYEENSNSLSSDMIAYMNTLSNAQVLSEERMHTEKKEEGESAIYSSLCKAIIAEGGLNNDTYELLIQSIPWWYNSFEAEISKEKMALLIQGRRVNHTPEAFIYLSQNYPDISILIIEKYTDKFIEQLDDFNLDSQDLKRILTSSSINLKDKAKFVNSCDNDVVIELSENATYVAEKFLQANEFEIRDTLIEKLLLMKGVDYKIRIELFAKNIIEYDNESIEEFILNLGSDYEKITDSSKRAIISDNPTNISLLKNLERQGYISSFKPDKKGLKVYHKRA